MDNQAVSRSFREGFRFEDRRHGAVHHRAREACRSQDTECRPAGKSCQTGAGVGGDRVVLHGDNRHKDIEEALDGKKLSLVLVTVGGAPVGELANLAARLSFTACRVPCYAAYGNFLNNVNPRRGAVTCLRTGLSPASVTNRPLKGDVPTVDLVLGYRESKQSPILKLLLSRVDEDKG